MGPAQWQYYRDIGSMLDNGILLSDWAWPSMSEWVGDDQKGNSQYSDRSPNAVNALGEYAIEHHSASGASFKRILIIDQFTRDSRQQWGPCGKRWKGNHLGSH